MATIRHSPQQVPVAKPQIRRSPSFRVSANQRKAAMSVTLFLALWAVVAQFVSPLFLPSPLLVAQSLIREVTTGILLRGFVVSLGDLGLGLLLSLVGGSGSEF